jgi:hypothetical protein
MTQILKITQIFTDFNSVICENLCFAESVSSVSIVCAKFFIVPLIFELLPSKNQ